MKLISMVDFIYKVGNDTDERNVMSFKDDLAKIYNYAQFLKQPLGLGMFIPCVDNEVFNYSKHGNKEQYQEAQEKCLFIGFKIIDMHVENQSWEKVVTDEVLNSFWLSKDHQKWELSKGIKVIEDFAKYNHLQLTQTAIKQIGL